MYEIINYFLLVLVLNNAGPQLHSIPWWDKHTFGGRGKNILNNNLKNTGKQDSS